jgi:hypothetical protein
MPLLKTTGQVTIANGQSLSNAIDLGAKVLSGILIPAAWTAAGLSFQASDDLGVTWQNLYDATGSEVTITSAAVTAGRRISLDPSLFVGIDFLKVRSGIQSAPVPQGQSTILTLISVDSSQALGVRFGAASGGSGGQNQTPWLSDIDGGNHNLNNVASLNASVLKQNGVPLYSTVTPKATAIEAIVQNVTPRSIFVVATIVLHPGDTVQALIGAATPPTTAVGVINLNAAASGLGTYLHSFIVPPSYYYQIHALAGTPTINNWIEYS